MGIKDGFSSFGRALKDVLEGDEEGAEDILGDAEEREFKRYEEKQRKKELKERQKKEKAEAKRAASAYADDYYDGYDEPVQSSSRSNDKIWPPRSPEGNYSRALSGSGEYQRRRTYSTTFIAREFKDAQVISEALLNGQEITVNFAQAVPSDTQRIMDFICGCIYVINGSIKPVSDNVYLFIPGGSPEPEYTESRSSSGADSNAKLNRMI